MRVWRTPLARLIGPPLRLIWLALPALSLAPVLALGQGGGGASTQDARRPASGKYAQACAQGNAKYTSRDFQGAIALYRGAIEVEPENPLGYYLLGEAQLAAGNIAEAEAAWNRAALDSTEGAPALHARVLFVIADLKERQWKWNEAKAAWQIYLDWASGYPNAGAFPASARSRQQAIDLMLKQDRAYEVVRRRIAETKDGGVFTDLSKSP